MISEQGLTRSYLAQQISSFTQIKLFYLLAKFDQLKRLLEVLHCQLVLPAFEVYFAKDSHYVCHPIMVVLIDLHHRVVGLLCALLCLRKLLLLLCLLLFI